MLLPYTSEIIGHSVLTDEYLVSFLSLLLAPRIEPFVVEVAAYIILLGVLIGNIAVDNALFGYLQVSVITIVELNTHQLV